ncbi:MAG: hypothetical protein WBP26_04240 [Candidatus Saccharimonadales bacterium]
MSEFSSYHTQGLPPEWGGPAAPGYAGGMPPAGHNAAPVPSAAWGGNMAPGYTGGHNSYSSPGAWGGDTVQPSPMHGGSPSGAANMYPGYAPGAYGTGHDAVPGWSGPPTQEVPAATVATGPERRRGLVSRIKDRIGGSATSHGVVNAAPEVTPPSPWGAPGAESGYYSGSATAGNSWEQTAGGSNTAPAAPVSAPNTSGSGWDTRPSAGYHPDQSGPLPRGLFAEAPNYTPDRFRQGVQEFRGFVEQAGGAAQVTGQRAAELWNKTPEPVRVVAGAAGEAAAASFLGNYGVHRTGQGWDVNRRELVTGVAKTAFSPTSTARLMGQGRDAFVAGRDAGRAAATQQARDALRNVW